MKKNEQLIILELMNRRGMIKDKSLLYRLKNGFEGELEFIQWFGKYNKSHWTLETDYWFDMDGLKQIDDLLISSQKWIVVDVKHYWGKFQYINGNCILNNKLMKTDIFDSLETKTKKIRRLVADINSNIRVDSAMIFIGEHCQVELDCVPMAQVVMRNELMSFITGLEYANPMTDWMTRKIVDKLNEYRTKERPPDIALAPEQFSELLKGIQLDGCGHNDFSTDNRWITCKVCGTKETFKSVVSRHAIELSYLFYYYPKIVTTKNVHALMGGQITKRTVQKYLKEEFKVVGMRKNCYYKVR
ncbi:nuclease-related domain-containing protein [Fundicoccus sp. Sow4_H7]|uniref:nuclease-related domain-containing protein n=1 Tax=Fundicoccus sp. Sow4_H7 TaxID=3438784 RepID=UPI003F8EEC71